MREFATGATRDSDDTKPDYEGFISPLVTKRFGEYMTAHRKQADGKLRASDNWQKGIPLEAYVKSLCRHVQDLLLHWDGYADLATDKDPTSVLCAIRFNVDGFLHELLKGEHQCGRAVRGECPYPPKLFSGVVPSSRPFYKGNPVLGSEPVIFRHPEAQAKIDDWNPGLHCHELRDK